MGAHGSPRTAVHHSGNPPGPSDVENAMRIHLPALAALVMLTTTACGDGADDARTDTPASGSEDNGTIAVHIQELDGVFVEGFEVGLRFETPDGQVIASTLWSDFVEAQDSESIDAYYESVLEQNVPAGAVVVLASANVGIGPPPEVPDLEGDLRCRLEVEVRAAVRVDVEITFDDPADCLRLR